MIIYYNYSCYICKISSDDFDQGFKVIKDKYLRNKEEINKIKNLTNQKKKDAEEKKLGVRLRTNHFCDDWYRCDPFKGTIN